MIRSELEKRLIEEGLRPSKVPEPATELREVFFGIALDVLKRGAPGLTDVSRTALARSISLHCERATQARRNAA